MHAHIDAALALEHRPIRLVIEHDVRVERA